MMLLSYDSNMMPAFSVYYSSSALVLVVLACTVIRRRYFSPIKDVPGPFLASITRLHHVYHIYMGKQSHWVTKLHEEYGPCVRIAPDEVSVSHPDAPKKLLLSVLHKVRLSRLHLKSTSRSLISIGPILSCRCHARLSIPKCNFLARPKGENEAE